MEAISIYGNALRRVSTMPSKKHRLDLSNASLIECCNEYVKFQRKKNPNYQFSVMEKIEKMEGEITHEPFEPIQVTDDFWVAFINWLQMDEGLLPSTVKTYCTQLRCCLKWASKHNAPVDPDFDTFDIDAYKPTKIALTIHQMHKIYDFDFSTLKKTVTVKQRVYTRELVERNIKRGGKVVGTVYKERSVCHYIDVQKVVNLLRSDEIRTLERVRDMFVLQCNLFQRHSDMVRITPDCFNSDKSVFTCIQQKTGNKAVVDMKKYCIDYKITKEILEKYGYNAPYTSSISNYNKKTHYMLQLIGGEFCQDIKIEYKRLGEIVSYKYPMWKMVSSHTGRRTAITFNALTRKYPHLEVMRCSGHSDFRAFQLYIKYDTEM